VKAARLHEHGKPLRIDDVPVPEVKGGEVLVKIAGAGVCHSDLHHAAGAIRSLKLPLTMGHENAGYVEEIGEDVPDFKKGEAVAVFGGWGCGDCHFCRRGEDQLCNVTLWGGVGVDGGFAQFLRVPSYRYLIRLDGLDPVESAPLTDAGLTPYHAIKKTLPYLYPGSAAVIIGAGGLGHLGLQIMKVISPGARVIVVDIDRDKLRLASRLGADHVIDGRTDVIREIKRLTLEEGAQAIIDMVGVEGTLRTATLAAGRKGIIVLVGLAGGAVPYSYFGVPRESIITTSSWGTYAELGELLELARARKIKANVQRFPLEDINEAFRAMKAGEVARTVLTFD